MPKSLFSEAHLAMVQTLAAARKECGLDQRELAVRLGKDQSFISNIERGQRRVDVIEFFAIARAMGIEPMALFRQVADSMPSTISI